MLTSTAIVGGQGCDKVVSETIYPRRGWRARRSSSSLPTRNSDESSGGSSGPTPYHHPTYTITAVYRSCSQSALHSQVPSRSRHFDLQLVIPVGRLISVTPVWCSTRGPRGPSFGLSWVSDGFWVGYLVLPISTTLAPQSLPPNPTLPPISPS